MEDIRKFLNNLTNRKQMIVLVNVLAICVIVYLIYASFSLWENIFSLCMTIIKPFLIGFIIAYAFSPLVNYLENKKMPRWLAITLVVSLLLVAVSLLVISLIPMLYNKALELSGPLVGGLMELQELSKEYLNIDISLIVDSAIEQMTLWFSNLSFMDTTFGLISTILGKIGGYIINLILAIYFLADYRRIHHWIGKLAKRVHPNFAYCLKRIDQELMSYIQAFLILMVIQGAIYAGIYFVLGNPNWLLLGLLSGLSCILPYIGPLAVNALGIITTLGMPLYKLILLLVAIFVQSNLDSYFITPRIYASRIEIKPIWTIFGIMTASTLFGPWGIIIAMPTLVIIKITTQTIMEIRTQKRSM